MRALDWIGRVLVLVLSTLATFSIIASLVSVSSPVAPQPRAVGDVEVAVEPMPQPSGPSTPKPIQPSASAGAGAESDAAAQQRDSRELARWLRALTYAVLGLAGFVAVLVIVAMRATAHLGAIADRR